MEDHRAAELRVELEQLLRKQREVLDSRMRGTASEVDVLEYEIREEIIHELCSLLSNATAA